MENLSTRLFYMKNAKEDVRSDIAVMKRAAEKAEVEISQSEIDKQRQVSYIIVSFFLFMSPLIKFQCVIETVSCFF